MPRFCCTYEEALYRGEFWTPSRYRPSLWFDMQDLKTLTLSSGTLTNIKNKGSSGLDGFIDTGRSAPEFYANSPFLNGFNGFGKTSNAGWFGINVNSCALKTFYIVCQQLNGTESTFSGSFQFLFGSSGGVGISAAVNTANFSNSLGTGSGTYRNGSLVSSSSAMPMPATVWEFDAASQLTAAWMFGNRQTVTGRTWSGRIAEIIAYDSTPPLPIRQKITGYLGWKYRIKQVPESRFANRPPLNGD